MAAPAPTAPTAPANALDRLGRGGWWLLLPLACHLGLSWIGFTPTDDGWMQATARRLLDGEVPHRDFIFVRPALSAALQMPIVAFGGEWTIWLSRLWGWAALAAIAWLWTGLAGLRGLPRFLVYATATLLSAHTFPVMAWHTIDGLLLGTLAVVAVKSGRFRTGFILAGCAALCRHNFGVFAPLLLLAVGGPVRSWFVAGACSLLPVAVYVGLVAALGGGRDFLVQIFSTQGAFRQAALDVFVARPEFGAAAVVGLGAGIAGRRFPSAPALLAAAAATVLLVQLWRGPAAFIWAGFLLAGAATGAALGGGRDRLLHVAGLGLAWAATISIGYNHPGLSAGLLLILLVRAATLDQVARLHAPRVLALLAAVALATTVALVRARLEFPYRDLPARDLPWSVGEALPGGSGLRTHNRTIATLAELRMLALEREAAGRTYAVLTDNAAHWIRSGQRNPLPCDWPQETELGYSQELVGRFIDAIRALPPGAEIIVQRYLISEYSWILAPVPVEMSYYYPQHWVRANWRKVGETRFFEIYAAPTPAAPAAP
jgi:hypothetical protein